jgi:hypothetical protein
LYEHAEIIISFVFGVIDIDPGDISKHYAKEMKHLCGIWDGSHQNGARGYHLCQIVISNTEHTKVVPCYSHLWSSEEENYQSKQTEIFKTMIHLLNTLVTKVYGQLIERAMTTTL